MSKGYVYALINPSLPGLVKVGKTVKEPEERAKELSTATGVPTPFIVAYKVYVNDCDYGEKYLHTLLGKKGHRINQNREFFNTPLDEIINSMIELKNSSGVEKINEDYENENTDYSEDFIELLEEADGYYYGTNDESEQDYSKALKLYKQAINLGAIEAYARVGVMYIDSEGCEENYQTALNYFKEGVKKGNENCFAEMGRLFAINDQPENARKCFKKYFESKTFKEDKQNFVLLPGRIPYVMDYLSHVRNNILELEFIPELSKLNNEMYESFQKTLEY